MSFSLQVNDTWEDTSSLPQVTRISIDQWIAEANRLKLEIQKNNPTPLTIEKASPRHVNSDTRESYKPLSNSTEKPRSRAPESPQTSNSYNKQYKPEQDRRRSREREGNSRDYNSHRESDNRRQEDRGYKRREDYKEYDDRRDNYRRDYSRRDERPDNRYSRRDDRYSQKDRDYPMDRVKSTSNNIADIN